MSKELADKFIRALENVESGGDVEEMAGLFADECAIGNVTLSETLRGRNGVKEFWTHYKRTLREVKSKFRNKIVSDGTIALEWTTEGEENTEVGYEGVSILETDGGKITRFFAYFNPAKLGTQLSQGAQSRG